MNQIIKDLTKRYTTKKYDSSKQVSSQDMDIILESLRLSASSINSQPWKFVVIQSDEAKKRFYSTFSDTYKFNIPRIEGCSHIILFGHNKNYTKENFEKVVDKYVKDGRVDEQKKEKALSSFSFVSLIKDSDGSTNSWAKAQTYLAFGSLLQTLARLDIDSTSLEGIDINLVNKEFKQELSGHWCEVAIAIGYSANDDYNKELVKSRLTLEEVVVKI
jgi:nitroreductase/dihydropteridine reductase